MLFEFGMKSEKGFVCVLLLAYLYLLSTKMANSNLFGVNISLIHKEFVEAYKERFLCENRHVASVKRSKLWQKMRRENKTLSNLKSQVSALIKKWKHESKSASPKKGTMQCFWKNSKKGKLISFVYSIKINGLRFSFVIYKCSCDSLTLL